MGNGLIIFDIGGVFRDSSAALQEGYRKGFESAGIDYRFLAVDVWHLRGLGRYNDGRNGIRALLAISEAKEDLSKILLMPDPEARIGELVRGYLYDSDEPEVEKIHSVYKDFFNSEAARELIKTFPGSAKVVQDLRKSGYALAMFSNSSKVTIQRDLSELGLDNFSAILSEEDVKRRKPSGEGIVKIMHEIHRMPNETYYVGDAVSDIIAARDAGCMSVAVLSGMGLKEHLSRANPDLTFASIAEMCDYFVNKE